MHPNCTQTAPKVHHCLWWCLFVCFTLLVQVHVQSLCQVNTVIVKFACSFFKNAPKLHPKCTTVCGGVCSFVCFTLLVQVHVQSLCQVNTVIVKFGCLFFKNAPKLHPNCTQSAPLLLVVFVFWCVYITCASKCQALCTCIISCIISSKLYL